MKIHKNNVELNYKLAGYKCPEDVPYWRLYIYKVKRYEVEMRKCTTMELFYKTENAYNMEDLHTLLEPIDKYGPDYRLIAWARKSNKVRK